MNRYKFFHSLSPTDEIENTRISYFTNAILLSTISITLVLSVIKIILPPEINLSDYIIWTLIALFVIIYIVFKKGKASLAGSLYVITLWLTLTILAWTFEGVRDVGVVGYILPILIAMLITRPWQALTISFLSIISLWIIFFAENNQIIIPQKDTSFNYSIELTVILILVITLIYLNLKSYSGFYSRIQKELEERKSAEEALNNSEKKYRELVENLNDVIFTLDKSGIVTYISPQVFKLYGYKPEELVGYPFSKIIYPDDLKYLKGGFEATLNNRIEIREFRYQSKTGEIRWANTSSHLIIEGENVTGISGIFTDITDRKKAGEDLLMQSRLQELLMNLSTTYINLPLELVESTIQDSLGELGEFIRADRVFVFNYDFQNQTVSASHEWCRDGNELQFDLYQALPLSFLPDWDVNAHRRGDSIFIPDTLTIPPGELRKMFERSGAKSLLAVPLMSSGECLGFVGFSSIEGYHYFPGTEQRLMTVFTNMLVNIRERKKAEVALIVAKEKAEESDNLKTAFMNNISHEVRTPLNGILGFAQLVLQPDISEEEKGHYLEVLNSSSERLLSTVTNYMDISLIVSGNIKVRKEPLILSRLLNKIYEEFKTRCDPAKLELIKEIPSDETDTLLLTDASLLEKSISHLVDNAIKFTRAGSVILGFRLNKDEYEIFVKDTGSGINGDAQEKIFEYFMQEEVSNTRGYEGSGLGLSIAKGLVELLGGKIRLESVKGEGSTFFITLAVEKRNNEIIESPQIKQTKASSEISPVILIADDDDISITFHKTVLEKASFKYLTARNGSEAVKICLDHPEISLILMDIKMPVMNGLEATRKIREFRKDIPIIGVTAYAMRGDKESTLAAGCDDYLSKPVQPELLLLVINKYL